MDSGNSGSVQSSSGGCEEFDSRTESISSFFNNNPSSHIVHGPSGSQQPPPLMMQQQQSMLFDPLSRSPQLAHNPNSLLNLDTVWSKNVRSEPSYNDLGRFMASSSSSSPTQQLQAQSRATFSSMQQFPLGLENSTKVPASGTNTDQPNNNNNNMVRNSKKRSRASRRAPTTVLTTDTTNFRAMVQEFTGIPAPPFNSSPFQRSRLDLFGTPSNPHYLLRPHAQKLHYPPSFTISSMVDAIASTPSTNSSSTSTSINYHQLPPELGLLKQPQNTLNMQQNPILNYVSLLQTSPKYPISSNDQSPLRMGIFDDFGLSQGQHGNTNTNNLSGLQNMVSSSEATGSQQHDQSLLRSINGSNNNCNTQTVTNGDDKGTKNVASRSEGMVETWICSSD